MIKSTLIGILLAIIAAIPAASETRPSRACTEEDMVTYVKGGRECIAIQIVGSRRPADTLVVFIHGDVSRGGPADYFSKYGTAQKVDTGDTLTVNMIRLGYYTSDGRYSSGNNNKRRDNTTKAHNKAIAAAVSRLKSHYRAKRVVMVGHSAGALTIGAIIGQDRGLVDHAILVSCPCDTQYWAKQRGGRARERRQNPMRFVRRVPATTTVTAITGEQDDNTIVPTVSGYIARLKKRGVSARLLIVPGAGHNFEGGVRTVAIREARKAIR